MKKTVLDTRALQTVLLERTAHQARCRLLVGSPPISMDLEITVLLFWGLHLLICVSLTEPVKPKIEVPETGLEIPVGDGSPVVMNIGDNVTAASNTTITIKCPVSGVPTPSVIWLKDEVEIIPGEEFRVTDDNSLVIKGADLEDNGKYSCTVGSEFGKDDISSIVNIIG